MQANTPGQGVAATSDPKRGRPLVSVLYLTYKHEAFAREAVHSVLAQTYPHLDIVILDDASPDGTADIIRREVRRHPRRADVRVFSNDHNLGEFGNTRKGLSLALGDFIVLFNGDDVMLPTLVEAMANVWLHTDVSLVTANSSYIDETGRELNRFFRDPGEPYDDSFETLARHCSNAVCFGAAMGFERSLYEQFGWPPPHLGAEDVLMPFYAYLAKGARFIPEPLLKYRVTGQNASMTLQWERSTNPVEKLIVWQEDRHLHLAHAFRMINELERLSREDPERYGTVERRIRPLLDALVHERARQIVDARTELHELGVPFAQLRPAPAPVDTFVEPPATMPLTLHEAAALVSSRANGAPPAVKLFVVLYNDARLLEPFLGHYQKAGIDEFYIATAPEYRSLIDRFVPRYKLVVFDDLDVGESMSGGTLAVSAMRGRHQAEDEWVVIVDLDEFVEFTEAIDELIAAADREEANVVRGIMYDRFAADGNLVDFAPGADIAKVYPVKARFTRDVMQGCDHKGVLVKGRLKSIAGGGHHEFEDERVFSRTLDISHYKWNSTAIARVKRAHAELVRMDAFWAVEYERVIAHYEHHGRFAWETFGGELVGDD